MVDGSRRGHPKGTPNYFKARTSQMLATETAIATDRRHTGALANTLACEITMCIDSTIGQSHDDGIKAGSYGGRRSGTAQLPDSGGAARSIPSQSYAFGRPTTVWKLGAMNQMARLRSHINTKYEHL